MIHICGEEIGGLAALLGTLRLGGGWLKNKMHVWRLQRRLGPKVTAVAVQRQPTDMEQALKALKGRDK